MPASLTIAIFVFGAVLFLIGLLGGAFKLFGTEVAGTVGPRIRAASLVLGMGFIIWGLLSETRVPVAAPIPAARAGTNESVAAIQPAPAPVMAEPAVLRNPPLPLPASDLGDLSGVWRDETGTVYQVWQSRGGYSFRATNDNTRGAAEGLTKVQGLRWTSSFETNIPSTGTGSGTFSNDGMQMMGTFNDSRIGTYSRTLVRVR